MWLSLREPLRRPIERLLARDAGLRSKTGLDLVVSLRLPSMPHDVSSREAPQKNVALYVIAAAPPATSTVLAVQLTEAAVAFATEAVQGAAVEAIVEEAVVAVVAAEVGARNEAGEENAWASRAQAEHLSARHSLRSHAFLLQAMAAHTPEWQCVAPVHRSAVW
eukprot:CAMPEP_0119317574 /NCGR_PEP_ID=MMETSP1333-20130426/43594_1 /TAXON_ID=418940 /ORGANISM="Scyphosphaera apsteinii, Strain RCC1455" /LENGTH=163 /DNA_ID=CAMNT_0007323549 /DNA_START=773 /DNA_END=1261 /DNA_ORIENTATION=-